VTYHDYDEMLADPTIDAVIVAIADEFHVEACKKALAANKHVLVEKPLATSVAQANHPVRGTARSSRGRDPPNVGRGDAVSGDGARSGGKRHVHLPRRPAHG